MFTTVHLYSNNYSLMTLQSKLMLRATIATLYTSKNSIICHINSIDIRSGSNEDVADGLVVVVLEVKFESPVDVANRSIRPH